MEILVHIHGCTLDRTGFHSPLHVCARDAQGNILEIDNEVLFDFTASPVTMNQRFINRAREMVANQGWTVPGNANIKLIGGVV